MPLTEHSETLSKCVKIMQMHARLYNIQPCTATSTEKAMLFSLLLLLESGCFFLM